ncbi:hypothetical protein [Halostella litorea]|uniref:hypothetical protein n=1 Tax=Halostella litorea TaxID=2528831 RepID=UPI00109188E2|nr:hypothetical protein [Halostella litorea]
MTPSDPDAEAVTLPCPQCGYDIDPTRRIQCPRCGERVDCSSVDCGECGSCPSVGGTLSDWLRR